MEHRPASELGSQRLARPSWHQRIDGAARIVFGVRGISDLYQRAPCRLLFPASEDGGFPEAVSITTSGGLTGGDRIKLDIGISPGSQGTVTTQAAEKLYRVLPEDRDIRIETRIDVDDEGRCEWLAQEAIAFDRTRFRRRVEARLKRSSRLLAVESVVFGRIAMGETFSSGLIHDEWRIWRDGRLLWADGFHADGDFKLLSARPFGLGTARAMATLVYAGADAADHLDLARTLANPVSGGATYLDGLLILRLMDRDPQALRAAVMRSASAMRAATLGLPARLPAVWYC